MNNTNQKPSAHAQGKRDRAPRKRTSGPAEGRPYRLSDDAVRRMYQRSEDRRPATRAEHALFLITHRAFIDAIFNGDEDLDARFPEPEDDEP